MSVTGSRGRYQIGYAVVYFYEHFACARGVVEQQLGVHGCIRVGTQLQRVQQSWRKVFPGAVEWQPSSAGWSRVGSQLRGVQ